MLISSKSIVLKLISPKYVYIQTLLIDYMNLAQFSNKRYFIAF